MYIFFSILKLCKKAICKYVQQSEFSKSQRKSISTNAVIPVKTRIV